MMVDTEGSKTFLSKYTLCSTTVKFDTLCWRVTVNVLEMFICFVFLTFFKQMYSNTEKYKGLL